MALSTQECLVGNDEGKRQKALVQHLSQKLGPSIFDMWFADGSSVQVSGDDVTIWGESKFAIDRLAKNFGREIEFAVRHCCSPRARVRYQIGEPTSRSYNVDHGTPDVQANHRNEAAESDRALIELREQQLDELCQHSDATTTSELATERRSSANATSEPTTLPAIVQATSEDEHGHPMENRHQGPAKILRGEVRSPATVSSSTGGSLRLHSARTTTSDPAFRRKHGLESFWFGETNRLAQVSVRQAFQSFGQFSPIFVYGPSGSGKTHLLESIAVDARKELRLRRCVFMSAEQFTTYFVQALRGTGLPTFRRKYRDLDLLAIDDVQFFGGKKATLSEFQFTIDSLHRAGKQVVLASDRPPIELNHFGAELTARLTAGLICPIEYPDEEGRAKIIQRMCKQRHVDMPSDVVNVIASRLGRDVRRLSGAVNRIYAVAQARQCKMTLEMANEVLADLFSVTSSGTSLPTIEKVVCEFCGVNPSELRSSSRRKSISSARTLAMYLSRQYTSSAYSEIGDYFGGRSHSTVIAANKKANLWIEENSAISLSQRGIPGQGSNFPSGSNAENRLRTKFRSPSQLCLSRRQGCQFVTLRPRPPS